MRFYEPAEYQLCYYYKRIENADQEDGCPVRECIYTFVNASRGNLEIQNIFRDSCVGSVY